MSCHINSYADFYCNNKVTQTFYSAPERLSTAEGVFRYTDRCPSTDYEKLNRGIGTIGDHERKDASLFREDILAITNLEMEVEPTMPIPGYEEPPKLASKILDSSGSMSVRESVCSGDSPKAKMRKATNLFPPEPKTKSFTCFDGTWLTFQAAGLPEYGTLCDQIYKLDLTIPPEQQIPQRISTGIGACTCSYFYPDNRHLIYAGTFQYANFSSPTTLQSCPEKACQSERAKTDAKLKHLCNTSYTWDLFPEYDIYKVNEFGTVISRLTDTFGYDAEGAVSPDGRHIVFTSLRSGDPEIWIMNSDGSEPKQLTNELGYDGGPFFSPDGTKIVFRASRPKTDDEIQLYKDLLSYNLVSPLEMELYTINIDGTGLRQITRLGGSNWAPFYMPDNRRIIFSSNFNESGRFGAFNLYIVDEMGVERITFNEGGFDAFPMFDRAGQHLVWGSSRNGRSKYDLNLFIAEWNENRMVKRKDGVYMDVINSSSPNTNVKAKSMGKIEQLTKNDINTAPCFSLDDKRVLYEGYGTELYGTACEQIMDLDLMNPSTRLRLRRLSAGFGAARFPTYISNGSDIYEIIYASDILTSNRSSLHSCPRRACSNATQSWVKELCYDGEASVSPNNKRIIFTSTRNGDPDLWIMNADGQSVRQLTKITGYEGGAKFSPDGRFIVFHATRPASATELAKYGWLLQEFHAVELANTQIFLMHSDGSGLRQLTKTGINLWPTFVNNKRVLFASTDNSKSGIFNIFAINVDGSDLEQITFDRKFMNFYPTISHDGHKLLWSKSTNIDGQLNLYLTDWESRGFKREFGVFSTFRLFPVTVLSSVLSFVVKKLYAFVSSSSL